ncbi:MAG: class II glutamine amidotransferase [Hahellaceae bacterium]|nr:class II glutamine amidotransferase [Hahellaceae bacterium]
MCELFALSSQLPTRVTFSLEEFSRHGASESRLADGWSLAFYDGPDAQIFREPRPAASSEWMKFILSRVLQSMCHVTYSTSHGGSVALRNTQPFSRVMKGHRRVFCHNGDLKDIQSRINLDQFSR